ncbi:MAG: thioredoxin family protein [Halobacteriota archaeon]|nr:thioredoxin family protein [Halobacteriota archaeon]
MKLIKGISIILLLLLLCGTVQASSIEWHTYDEGMALAKELNKPVMIDFYKESCPACIRMDKETYTDKDVIQMSENFVNIKVDVEASQDSYNLAIDYGVSYLPTIAFTDPEGDETGRIIGYSDAETFEMVMESVLDGKGVPITQPQAPGFGFLLSLSSIFLVLVWLVKRKS